MKSAKRRVQPMKMFEQSFVSYESNTFWIIHELSLLSFCNIPSLPLSLFASLSSRCIENNQHGPMRD